MGLKYFLAIASVAACLASFANAQCVCGTGFDYGCDQRKCGPGATCLQGHCNQDGLEAPECEGGACSQINATNTTCEGGNCCPPLDAEQCSFESNSQAECIGAEMRLFSCTANKYVPAKSLRVGDSVRGVSARTGETACSDVYYAYRHQSESLSYAIRLAGARDDVVVSPNHLLYVGTGFGGRRAVRAKDVRVGDSLVSSSADGAVVESIGTRYSELVNVLAFEPAIELEGGVVISAHSFDETLYAWMFWPFALSYKFLGAATYDRLVSEGVVDALYEQTGGAARMATSLLALVSI